jgi:tRNA 2-selenouridine synthase
MGAPIIETEEWKLTHYDMVIDVRSPSEFLDDHIPGAVNMPVLSDVERADIGTIYKQQSSFLARKKGAALVARNIAGHLDNQLKKVGPEFSPLIHCWRGGQRSRAFAQICSEIGWKSYTLKGGYKSYRRSVLRDLEEIATTLVFIVIAGRTGSGKTDILKELMHEGAQVLDLEGLAVHRGSLLGKIENRLQPSQRLFESNLCSDLLKFNLKKPIYVESESSKIGNVQIPKDVWKQIVAAPMISIITPTSTRATYLLSEYKHLMVDTSDLNKLVFGMTQRHGQARTKVWRDLIKAKNWQSLAENLLKTHYDPAYDKSILRHNRLVLAEIKQQDCLIHNVKATATHILDLAKG